jgi:hypothetical protein
MNIERDEVPEGERGLTGQHNIGLSILLHILPGAFIVLAYYFIGIPAAAAAGYPTLFGFFLACMIVLVPWELGFLFLLGKKRNGSFSLEGIVGYRERTPKPKLFLFVFILFCWALAVAILLSSIDSTLRQTLFAWVPNTFELDGFTPLKYSRSLFDLATLVNLLSFGIAFPWIEELYFRGFLLPRMRSFGKAAPFANSVLFVLYHLWSPWQAVTRVLFVTPIVWLVWKKRSIEIGIWAHCFLNSFGIILTYVTLTGT